MDDLILIVRDNPNNYLEKVVSEIEKLDFEINYEKTTIKKLYQGDYFLGFKFLLSNTGKVYQCIATSNLKRERRKCLTQNQNQFDTWWSYATKSTSKKRIMEVKERYAKYRKNELN